MMPTCRVFRPATFVITLIVCWQSSQPALAVDEPTRLKSSITGVQPMTGIVLWSDNPVAARSPETVALEYRYCGYNEVVTDSGTYDFSHLDKILDTIASRNHQAVIRFYFCYPGRKTTVPAFIRRAPGYSETVGKSEGQETHFCDWSHPALQEFTLQFYTKFAERYDRDPRIAFLQTGFGLWAEYHIYDGPRQMGKTFPSKQFQNSFLKHLHSSLKGLPWSISVDAADDEYSPVKNNQALLDLRFGVFDDSFLCKQHPKVNAVNWKTLSSDRWNLAPAGGEFSYYNRNDQRRALAPNGPNGVAFEAAAKQFHISYMIGNDQTRHSEIARIRTAGMATGYRFRVTGAEWLDSQLRLTVTNTGVAPLYRDAFFEVVGQRSESSLKGLLPGEDRTFVIDNVTRQDATRITIQSDAILPTQKIEFEADVDIRS